MRERSLKRSDKKRTRRRAVLTHVVRQYVSSSEPVSSGTVTELMNRSCSSATVRNIMGQLEEEGFLEQLHTSSGRIPTDKAYRYFVNNIRDRIKLREREYKRLAREYSAMAGSLEELIERTSNLLSRELRKASLVMWPSLKDTSLQHIGFVKVARGQVLAVIVTMTNAVKKYLLDLASNHSEEELTEAAGYLNKFYRGATFLIIADNLARSKEDAEESDMRKVYELLNTAHELIEGILKKDIENDIYWEGLDYFLEEQFADDLAVTRRLVRAVTGRRELVRILRDDLATGGMSTHIGSECGTELNGLSLITCGYDMEGRAVGRLGVIGGTRMDYERVLGTVRFLAELLSLQLKNMRK